MTTTYVDILRQQLIARLVLAQDVSVDAGTREGAAEEEAEESVMCAISLVHPFINLFLFFVSHAIRDYDHTTPQYTAPDQFRLTHPPRKAPTGLRAGSGASERTRAVAWKPRAAAVAGELRIRA